LAALLVVAAPARAADPSLDAQQRAVLKIAADRHTPQSAALRDKSWDSQTVARLAQWIDGKPGVATTRDVALLQEELGLPISLSVSGAVSLGSYQGGFLYYYVRALTEARRLALEAPKLLERAPALVKKDVEKGVDKDVALSPTWGPPGQGSPLSIVTGASSGSINAVIAAITSCQAPIVQPRESVFWKTWLPVSADALKSEKDTFPDGLLSEQPISEAIDRLTAFWTSGKWLHDPLCAVDLGLSATRMHQRMVKPIENVNLTLPVQTEKLMFSMRGRLDKPGAPPDLLPFAPPDDDPRAALFRQRLRQLGNGDNPTIQDVTDLLRASSAFSFAFPPNPVNLTLRDGSKATDNTLFTDGGVFDDRPVGLAVQMNRWHPAGPARTRYIIQDPDATEYQDEPAPDKPPTVDASPARAPKATAEPPGLAHKPFFETWWPFAQDFISTAFEIELMDTLEREPTLYAGIEIPPRREPVAGAYLIEFMAFAEEDFRVFDFFTGMVDAWQQLAQSSLAFQVLEAAHRGPVLEHAPEFDCLMAWRLSRISKTGTPPRSACAAVGTDDPPNPLLRRNLEALLHASAETRVWANAPRAANAPDERHVFLQALSMAREPYVYRQLKYHGKPAVAETVDLALREDLQRILVQTTRRQPVLDVSRDVVGTVGKAAVNFYVYQPPSVFFATGLVMDRGIETIAAHTLSSAFLPGLRAELALRFLSLHWGQDETEPSGHHAFLWTPMLAAHLSNEITSWSGGLFQFQFGLGWAARLQVDGVHPVAWRHGPEALFGMTFLQRLYLDLVGDYYLDDCANNNHCANISAKVPAAAPPVADSRWGARLDIGIRWFLE
jgi:Patatin-like phospholipase